MVQPEVDPQPHTVYGPKDKIILNSVFVSTFFKCFFFFFAKPLKGEETCRRRSELAVINALFYFSCGLSTIKLFLYLSEREGKLCLKKKSVRSSEKKNALLIPIYVFITVFLFFLMRRQTELLPGSVGMVCLCV